jgi:hypothetical protein
MYVAQLLFPYFFMYNAATSLAYLRMRGDVTFLTDGSIMTEVNTIQAGSTFGSTHTQLLIKPENYCIIETHSYSMSTIFWDMTPCMTLKLTDILEKQTVSIFRVKPSKQQALCLLFVWLLLNPDDGDTSENSTLHIHYCENLKSHSLICHCFSTDLYTK